MKIAVVGASGFVGHHLWKAFCQRTGPCVGTFYNNATPGLIPFDLRQNPALLPIENHQALLIASARSLISDCENQPEATRQLNVTATLALASYWAQRGLKIIFLSSDYVFDGVSGNYNDEAHPNPTTEYGRQKAAVEAALPGLIQNWLVLRLSKVYGLDKGDATLLDQMASQLIQGQNLQVASDQIFCPTWIEDVTQAAWATRHLTGVINLCSPEPCSRFMLASQLQQGLQRGQVEEISLHQLPGLHNRPLNTSMQPIRLQNETNSTFIALHQAITTVISHWRPA